MGVALLWLGFALLWLYFVLLRLGFAGHLKELEAIHVCLLSHLHHMHASAQDTSLISIAHQGCVHCFAHLQHLHSIIH